MSDLQAIKNRLLDEDKLIDIFEAMGCEYIDMRNGRIEAGLPDKFHSSNKRAVQCKLNDSLSSSIRNRPDFGRGDIYSLISYIVFDKRDSEIQSDLPNAKKFICETLGWDEFLKGGEYLTKIDYVAPLKALTKDRSKKREIIPNEELSEDILNDYFSYPSHDWIQEGISYSTQKMYGIGIDPESRRITIPMRNRFGKLVGVKARIMDDNDDERKYLYLYPYNNSQELFNFHYSNLYSILEKRIYIFEGEKSCMKMFENKLFNSVAIGSSDITDVQASMIKNLGLDIEIILCFDSDRTPDEIRKVSSVFGDREVKAIIDTKKLLGEKESPIDRGIETFNQLVNECCYVVE